MSATRRYSSALREDQMAMGRARVLDAAAELFLGVGYRKTTLAAIASAAGVSQQTVYNLVGGKAALLKAVYDRTLAADDESVAIVDRPDAGGVRAAPTAAEALRRYANLVRVLHERSLTLAGLVYAQAHTGEPEVAGLVSLIEAEKLAGSQLLVEIVEGYGPLGDGVTPEQARDVAWTLISTDIAERLVRNRGWSWDAYETWLGSALVASLLGPQL